MMRYLRHMLVFSQVVDAGSISAAAEALGLSKSVVSQQLKSLEDEVGVVLLNRTTRRQVLTPAGRDFYQRCQSMADVASNAWKEARETQALPIGSITISAPHALIDTFVAPAIGELVFAHDKIEPTILANDERVDLIQDGIDLAIRVGDMPSSDYRQILVGHFREVLCASPDYIAQKNLTTAKLVEDSDFRSHCDYIANHWQGNHIAHTCKHASTKQKTSLTFSANRKADSVSTVIALAKANGGLAFIPEFLLSPRVLRNVLPEYSFSPVPVYAVHPFGKNPPTLVRMSIDAIKKSFKAE